MAAITYRITISGLLIADAEALIRAVFPAADPLWMEYNQEGITAAYGSPQTPADLGPLVKVEEVVSP